MTSFDHHAELESYNASMRERDEACQFCGSKSPFDDAHHCEACAHEAKDVAMSDADLVKELRAPHASYVAQADGDVSIDRYSRWLTSLMARAADRIEELAAEVERLGKCYDRAIASRLEWRRQAESANRALAEAIKVIGFYADEGNWRSPSKGFALQYDPEPSAFQKDRGGAARDFITAQEKEKGK